MKSKEEQKGAVPLYLALAEKLRSDMETGRIPEGGRLPSMRDLARGEGISLGTVRQAYTWLEHQGLVTARRGQGTYAVSRPVPDTEGKKDQALSAIDAAISTLAGLGFSSREAQIFFELRLRQKEEATRPVRVAVVAASPEERAVISGSIGRIPSAGAYLVALGDVTAQPERLKAGFDLLAAPAELAGELEALLPEGLPLLPVVLEASAETCKACRTIPEGAAIGVLTASREFAAVLRRACEEAFSHSHSLEFEVFGDPERTGAFMAGKDVLVLSPDYSNFVERGEAALLRGPALEEKRVIRTGFHLDRGSMIYLSRAIDDKYGQLRQYLRD